MITHRPITLEEKESGLYSDCNECIHYENLYSSVFGDAWGCHFSLKNSCNVCDNSWYIEDENSDMVWDCSKFKRGDPKTYILG